MFLTNEQFWTLVALGTWSVSLLVCLILLLLPKFRKRSNPFAWIAGINLVAGLAWYAQFPLASARETMFLSANPGYADAALPFDGSSIYISAPRAMRYAAYDCTGSYSASLCEMPVTKMLRSGQVEFVEMDLGNRLVRYSISVHDPRCLDWQQDRSNDFFEEPFLLQDRWLSPGLGACVVEDEISEVTATHEISATQGTMGWPSNRVYYSVQLRNRTTGELLDQFDGWYGADPFLQFSQPEDHPRRPIATLAESLMIPGAIYRYDPAFDDQLLAQYGVDEDILRAAMEAPYQGLRAEALWMACRDSVVAALSADTRQVLTDASKGVFSSDWTYPQDCHDWMR